MMPAGHHSDSDSTLLPLPKSAITWFGGIFARLRGKCIPGCWTMVAITTDQSLAQFIQWARSYPHNNEFNIIDPHMHRANATDRGRAE